ncbi:GNAT family N-acetyltransferase [Halorussus lipolyticus]|uniref:GNAT family N-acetyltransferase n=1 Tax=Halorussus lipolyticus TaxID=3034024 RepID=UPI0023E7FE33|nr:GNAT family N-acetyltransferase [Halorussus sp. DT80]
MNDQSDDPTRLPKYGGPRDRQRTGPAWRRSDGPPRATRSEPRPRGGASAFESPVEDDLLEAFAVLDFETEAQKRVYRYVERQGVASDDEIHERIDLPTEEVAIAIQWLVQHGYLEADAGTFRVAHGTEVERTYRLGGLDVTIRPARQEDLAGLVGLIRTVTDDRTYVVAESVAAQLASEETVIRDTDTRSRLFFVATVEDRAVGDGEMGDRTTGNGLTGDRPTGNGRTSDSQLVGWAHLTLPRIEYLDHTAELTVGVRPDFRRRGIGSRLSGIAVAWAAANGYRKVYQSLPGTNRAAIDFLRNHGWRVEAVRPDHYRIDGEFVDEVMMAVEL